MKKPFERYNKYSVMKWEDIIKYLSPRERIAFDKLFCKVEEGRKSDNKKPNQYIVVNQKEPYAETVWELIEKHWDEQNAQNA
jgi:hypothetical protein